MPMTMQLPPTALVVVAAGSGRRMGGNVAKPFLTLHGRTVVEWTLLSFSTASWMMQRIVVLSPTEFDDTSTGRLYNRSLESSLRALGVTDFVRGGAERTQSVLNGVLQVDERSSLILVHDAVRPFATVALAESVAAAALQHGCAVPGVPVKDTIKGVDGASFVVSTPDRSTLRAIQTPQCFVRAALLSAYRHAGMLDQASGVTSGINAGRFTDEAMLIEAMGGRVSVVDGEPGNFKLTEPGDLAIAEARLASQTAPAPTPPLPENPS